MIRRVWIKTIGGNALIGITDRGKRRVTQPNCSASAPPALWETLTMASFPHRRLGVRDSVAIRRVLLLRHWQGFFELVWFLGRLSPNFKIMSSKAQISIDLNPLPHAELPATRGELPPGVDPVGNASAFPSATSTCRLPPSRSQARPWRYAAKSQHDTSSKTGINADLNRMRRAGSPCICARRTCAFSPCLLERQRSGRPRRPIFRDSRRDRALPDGSAKASRGSAERWRIGRACQR